MPESPHCIPHTNPQTTSSSHSDLLHQGLWQGGSCHHHRSRVASKGRRRKRVHHRVRQTPRSCRHDSFLSVHSAVFPSPAATAVLLSFLSWDISRKATAYYKQGSTILPLENFLGQNAQPRSVQVCICVHCTVRRKFCPLCACALFPAGSWVWRVGSHGVSPCGHCPHCLRLCDVHHCDYGRGGTHCGGMAAVCARAFALPHSDDPAGLLSLCVLSLLCSASLPASLPRVGAPLDGWLYAERE